MEHDCRCYSKTRGIFLFRIQGCSNQMIVNQLREGNSDDKVVLKGELPPLLQLADSIRKILSGGWSTNFCALFIRYQHFLTSISLPRTESVLTPASLKIAK
ncbi:uncharacterized protein LOC125502041 isoform X1 [Athalia rosae]|uniref:uncharacterized protein LOC125502041 isoform X1 n=1 Tax=Athalia rosae TaxID=37344 RepID=UPI002033DF4B|nr:uncharacterized protein LOC125502041 isoform X1 [Athalia rosae]